VDVQSGVSAAGGGVGVGGGPHLARVYTEAMEDSVAKRFTNPETGAADTINCMCHSTENLYRYKLTSVARASDDFYPDRVESQTVHVVNCAYNSLFLGEICLPDWDMFHSQHESAGLHAAARAVGGCPVYVSDKPGEHDPDILKRLVLPDGSVLRGQLPGRPTRDSLFADVGKDSNSALKIWNQNLYSGVVGAFNVQGVAWNYDTHENEVLNASPPTVTARVAPNDIESMRGIRGPFVAYRHQSASLEVLPTGDSTTSAELNHRGWEIFTIAPLQTLSKDNSEHQTIAWSPIGLGNMLNSGGAIVYSESLRETVDPSTETETTTARVTVRGPGRFVAYAQPAPSRVSLGGSTNLAFQHDPVTGMLTFDLPQENDRTHSGPLEVIVQWE
jgi:raffinose synthase